MGLFVGVALIVVLFGSLAYGAEKVVIKWATSSVGSSGYRALVNLINLLSKEMPEYEFVALPTPGAIFSVKGYCTGEYDGYYGADIAFFELATDSGRFKGFKQQMKREPVQSFWAYTMETGLAILARNKDKFKSWRDLSGQKVFTGPMPWDVRANLERALAVLGVKHIYVELDLGLVGSALERGDIAATIIYTAGEKRLSPWLREVELTTDLAVLNPSEEEIEILKEAGLSVVEVSPDVFERPVHAEKLLLVPFFYGLHLGMTVPEEDLYRILKIIGEKAQELAEVDASFAQLVGECAMPLLQARGIRAALGYVKIHPGLAKYLREANERCPGCWDPAWEEYVATP